MPPTPIEVGQAVGQLAKYGGMAATFGWRNVTVRVNILLHRFFFKSNFGFILGKIVKILRKKIKLVHTIKYFKDKLNRDQ